VTGVLGAFVEITVWKSRTAGVSIACSQAIRHTVGTVLQKQRTVHTAAQRGVRSRSCRYAARAHYSFGSAAQGRGLMVPLLLCQRHYTHCPLRKGVLSVIAFHEKAGRSQVGSFVFSLDKVFLPPSRYHCRHPSIRTRQ
jgi:hypothetical protein